jgi:hypothetical protein
MTKRYITFSGQPYDQTTALIVERGRRLGADDVRVYDDRWMLTQPFYAQNKWLWDHPHKRGFGWYAWKPYIIWHALSELQEGDVVLYVDADTYPIAPFGQLFDRCVQDGGILLFASENHRQHEWCKRDCYLVMGQDGFRLQDFPAGVARFMLFQKGPWRVTQFLMEWITYCVNPLATTFDPSVLGVERSTFIEHRTEQAIMSNLAHKYGQRLYREACQAGHGIDRDRDLYGQLFQQENDDVAHVTAQPVGSTHFNLAMGAYSTAFPQTCQTCSQPVTHRVFDAFSSTTVLVGYFCQPCAERQTYTLNAERGRRAQMQDTCGLDAQELLTRAE